MGSFRQLSVAFLVILVVIGLSGHLIVQFGGSQHALAESTCAIHQGMHLVGGIQPSWSASLTAAQPADRSIPVQAVLAPIPRPPTI